MKCANPLCSHGIGLVAHRRGLFGKRQYCSKQCRDHLTVERIAPSAPRQGRAATYVEWLFMQPAAAMQPKLATVRVRSR
jgi:hypothetical protein